MYDDKYCKIINRFTRKIIVAGKILNHKDIPIKCITFDNKHFFNLKWNIFYKVIFTNFTDTVLFDNVKYKNKIELWSNIKTNENAFIYREYDITELDKEVKDLVYYLNHNSFRTVGSCSGHGVGYAWVDISFETFNQLHRFLSLLSMKKIKDNFVLTTTSRLTNNNKDMINLELRTVKSGTAAYRDINTFVEYLKIIS